MKQYCRHCVNMFVHGGKCFCAAKIVLFAEQVIKRPNTCKQYRQSKTDAITGETIAQEYAQESML